MFKKIGFISVRCVFISSQVESAIFMLPASLALLVFISLGGWVISGSCVTLLALIFTRLYIDIPQPAAPYVYVQAAFGKGMAFLTSWIYLLVYLISDTSIVIAAVVYLAPLLGGLTPLASLLLEIFVLLIITLINIRGVSVSASMGLVLAILKCLPLLIIPLRDMLVGKGVYFYPINPHQLNISAVLSQAILMDLWCFIGLKTVIATTGISNNPRRTAPIAIIVVTSFVVVLHLLNSVGMMTAVSGRLLVTSSAPYVEATGSISGLSWDIATAFIVLISCIATLNCGVMVGRQFGYAAAQAELFTKVFAITNQYDFPYVNIPLIFFLKVALLLMTLNQELINQLTTIINVTVINYLFIYILCLVAFIKLNKKTNKLYSWMALLLLLLFCWLVVTGSSKDIWLSLLPILSGLPFYLWQTGKWKIWKSFRLVRQREIEHYNPFSYPYQLT